MEHHPKKLKGITKLFPEGNRWQMMGTPQKIISVKTDWSRVENLSARRAKQTPSLQANRHLF
jgi:hypothetical protein